MSLIHTLSSFANSFKSGWGVVSLGLAAGPLVALGAELQPPWPQGSAAISIILSASALFLAFARLRVGARSGRRNQRNFLREGSAAIILGIILLATYLFLNSQYVIDEKRSSGGTEESIRIVIGTNRLPQLAEVKSSDINLLRDHLYQPDEIWTNSSLTFVRLLLIFTFGFSFASLSYGTALISAATLARHE